MLELWLVDLGVLAPALTAIEAATCRLSADEHESAAHMPDAARARQWTASRVALRVLLEHHLGPACRCQPFDYAAGGRPRLPGADLAFNVSDSDRFVLIGLCRPGRIGVDIEAPRQVELSPERAALWIAAADGLARGAPIGGTIEARTLAAWTRFEAFAKARGPTLASCLCDLGLAGSGGRVTLPGEARQRAEASNDAAGLEVHDLALPQRLVAAIAIDRGLERPRLVVRLLDRAALAAMTGA